MMILAGDIGGTSARLALCKVKDRRGVLVVERTYRSQEYGGLNDIVKAFASSNGHKISAACFGIAGPVQDGRVVTPNLPWVVDAHTVARDLDLSSVRLLNDLEANAYGIAALDAQDFVTLRPGAAGAAGNAAVISVGTGLGEAGLFWNGETHLPFACEGGHADFAPRDPLEAELLLWLRAKYGHISYERVLSGPGLLNIYEFLRDTGKGSETPELREVLGQSDAPAAISAVGLAGRHELCVQALDLFVSLYGAEAGNLALKIMATGGVYIGGGIAPKILKKLKTPAFLEAFTDKGRMRPLLEAMPVKVITKDTAALLGAARVAAMSCS